MKLRPLMIGAEQARAAQRVIDFALSHRISLHEILGIMGGRRPPPGDDPQRVCYFPFGDRVAFSIEQQQKGYYRHISVSVEGGDPGASPSRASVDVLMQVFGFKDFSLAKDKPTGIDGFFMENMPDGSRAVNVMQRMNPQPE